MNTHFDERYWDFYAWHDIRSGKQVQPKILKKEWFGFLLDRASKGLLLNEIGLESLFIRLTSQQEKRGMWACASRNSPISVMSLCLLSVLLFWGCGWGQRSQKTIPENDTTKGKASKARENQENFGVVNISW